MTCETCVHSAEIYDRMHGLRFVCQRNGYAEYCLRWWRKPCYLREPGAEG